MKKKCPHCGFVFETTLGIINRANKGGYVVYCSRKCSGLFRRIIRSSKAKKDIKAKYDSEYREKNFDRLKKEKHVWFQKTYDPEKSAIERKKKMHLHVEYCRQPEYVKWKRQYDIKLRAKKQAGEYWESWILTWEIQEEFRRQVPDRYERMKLKGVIQRGMDRAKVRREFRRFTYEKRI